MDTLRVNICYRPLRVGWAVRRGDFDSLRKIFRFSHTLCGGRFNPVIIIDDVEQAKRLIELFRVDVIWPSGETQDVTSFPDHFPYLINPFFHESLIVGHLQKDKRSQLLDVHNTLVYMSSHDEIRKIQE